MVKREVETESGKQQNKSSKKQKEGNDKEQKLMKREHKYIIETKPNLLFEETII